MLRQKTFLDIGKEKEYMIIEKLSEILLKQMWDSNRTIEEMARICDISTRKYCEIIYKEKKGLRLSTLLSVCENAGISYSDVFNF